MIKSSQSIESQDEVVRTQTKNVQNVELLKQIDKLKEIIISSLNKNNKPSKQHKLNNQYDPKIESRINKIKEQDNPQSQQILVSKLSRLHEHQDDKLKKRGDLYQDIKKDWKIRITGRHNNKQNNLSQQKQSENISGQEQSTIIDKHLSFLKNSRIDSEEEQVVKMQLKNKPQRQLKQTQSAGQFNFKKVDIIPTIEQTRKNFRSYINKNKNSILNNNKTTTARYPNSSSKAQQSQFTSYFANNTNTKSQNDDFVTTMKAINKLTPLSPDQKKKEVIIQTGNCLFNIFKHRQQKQINFHIKKYKNCIVYCCLPQSTKAIIYSYNGNLYYGNIGLDQNGKFQKNGNGIEIVKGRHYYSGSFINGKKNGRGNIYYENGDIYDGQWHDGQIFGFGRYIQNKTDKMFEGFWKKGQYCGQKYVSELSPLEF